MTDLQLEICKKIYPYGYVYSVSMNWWEDSVVPISLPRVLSALWEWYTYYVTLEKIYDWNFLYIPRKLLTDSWSDATLRDQTIETQKKIAELLWVTF